MSDHLRISATIETDLNCEHDAVADILYAWVGDKPREAITYEDESGLLIRVDPEDGSFVGVTILDYEAVWKDKPLTILHRLALGEHRRFRAKRDSVGERAGEGTT
jgi:hypothetical protein